MGYDAELAEVYDAVYEGRGRGYTAEAAEVAALIRERRPGAGSLLDVACGTGAHLRCFAREFTTVAGVDLSGDMLALARRRLPDVPLHRADMRDFELDARFDAVTCMFSSIGHMADDAELAAAVARMAAHTVPGGVVVVEPWWFPETFLPGYVGSDLLTVGGRTLARVSHSTRRGDTTHMEVHYIVADPQSGARHLKDTHTITLFTRERYEAAFAAAGCPADYIEGGPSGRGLFVAVTG
ncbi:class I SAM-dependent methyltransferase [Nocardiopsis sediminis]|uniref:Class I SAM-dependent methyltransferase n=1 Tax=Nocardiopsis sediminis TaxID=1778267 RepID=A0ABV8FJ96_9ACTN